MPAARKGFGEWSMYVCVCSLCVVRLFTLTTATMLSMTCFKQAQIPATSLRCKTRAWNDESASVAIFILARPTLARFNTPEEEGEQLEGWGAICAVLRVCMGRAGTGWNPSTVRTIHVVVTANRRPCILNGGLKKTKKRWPQKNTRASVAWSSTLKITSGSTWKQFIISDLIDGNKPSTAQINNKCGDLSLWRWSGSSKPSQSARHQSLRPKFGLKISLPLSSLHLPALWGWGAAAKGGGWAAAAPPNYCKKKQNAATTSRNMKWASYRGKFLVHCGKIVYVERLCRRIILWSNSKPVCRIIRWAALGLHAWAYFAGHVNSITVISPVSLSWQPVFAYTFLSSPCCTQSTSSDAS
jgi:hypothetical protein